MHNTPDAKKSLGKDSVDHKGRSSKWVQIDFNDQNVHQESTGLESITLQLRCLYSFWSSRNAG